MKTFKDIKIGDRVSFTAALPNQPDEEADVFVGTIVEIVDSKYTPKGRVWVASWEGMGCSIPVYEKNFVAFARKKRGKK